MVRGVDKFREYFKEYAGQYVFIGGVACDIILGKKGEDFRATKDLDMVLLIEALEEEFIAKFIAFVEAGGYDHIDKGTGENQFFRFVKPKDLTFPYMIELFSKKPNYLSARMRRLGPVHISDDVMSLSAILLDDEYYELLKTGKTVVNEVSILDLEYIILFKMKAWLDLSDRKNAGERIDSKNIRKHKNDILRLAGNIDKDTKVTVFGQVRRDAEKFMEAASKSKVDVKSLGVKNATYDELLEILNNCYCLK